MIRRLIGWLLLLPFCVLLVFVALANRQFVTVFFDPFFSPPVLLPSIEVPLFMVMYFMLIVGITLGGLATWFSQGHQRREKRQWRSEAKKLKTEKEVAEATDLDNESRPGRQALIESN